MCLPISALVKGRAGCPTIYIPDFVRDLVVCHLPGLAVLVPPTGAFAPLQWNINEKISLCNETFETFAGECMGTVHVHACPAGSYLMRDAFELFIYIILQTSPSPLGCKLPHQHHRDLAQTHQCGTARMMQLCWGWLLQKAMGIVKRLNCVAQTCKSRHKEWKHPSIGMCILSPSLGKKK